MQEKIIHMVIQIVILLVIGCYLLMNKNNSFSKAFSRDKYNPQKVSGLLAFACFGIAISCIPSLLSVIFQKMWLNIFSVISLLLVIIISIIYEFSGKLK